MASTSVLPFILL